MKDADSYVVGKNIDQIERAKVKTNAATGNRSAAYAEVTVAIEAGQIRSMAQLRTFNAELAVDRPDYWRALIVATMSKPKVVVHPPKPWQESYYRSYKVPATTVKLFS